MFKEPLPTIVKLSIAALLIACILPLPFSMYHTIRNFCFVGFIYLFIYAARIEGGQWLLTLIGPCLIIFLPREGAAFGRTGWIITDVIIAVGLTLWTYMALRDYRRQRKG